MLGKMARICARRTCLYNLAFQCTFPTCLCALESLYAGHTIRLSHFTIWQQSYAVDPVAVSHSEYRYC